MSATHQPFARRPMVSALFRTLAFLVLVSACLSSCDSAGECVHPAPASQANAPSRWSAVGSGLDGVPEHGPVPTAAPDRVASQHVPLPDGYPAGPRALLLMQATHLRDGSPANDRVIELYLDLTEVDGPLRFDSLYESVEGWGHPAVMTNSDGWVAVEVPADAPLAIVVHGADQRGDLQGTMQVESDSSTLDQGAVLVRALREGEQRVVGIGIRALEGRTVCGRIVAADGVGVSGVDVWALPEDARLLVLDEVLASGEPLAVSDHEGRFCVTYPAGPTLLLLAREGFAPSTIFPKMWREYPSVATEYTLKPEASMCVRLEGDGARGVPYRARVSTAAGRTSRSGPPFRNLPEIDTEWSRPILVGGQAFFDRLPPDVLLQVELLDSEGAVLQHTTLHAPLGSEEHLVEVLKL